MDASKRNSSWWNKRTPMEKLLFSGSILAVLVIVALLIAVKSARLVLRTQAGKDNETSTSSPPNENFTENHNLLTYIQGGSNMTDGICLTPACVVTAASILKSIDFDVLPCDNFYQFACGIYLETAVIPDDITSVSTFSTLSDQLHYQLKTVLEGSIKHNEIRPFQLVKNYYRACLDKNTIESYGLQTLKSLLRKVGGWPVLDGPHWNDSDFSWTSLSCEFNEVGFDALPFIEIMVEPDLKNSSIHRIQLDQPEFGLNREFLLKGIGTLFTKAYFKFMVDVAVELGSDRRQAEGELKESLEFEIKMAGFARSKEETRNLSNLYNILSIGELQEKYADVSWLEFINSFLPNEVQVDANELVVLRSPKYLASLLQVIRNTPKRVQANYALWRAVKQQIPYLSDDLQQKQLSYSHVLTGVTERQARWKECVDEVSESLPLLASALYIRKYFQEDAKNNAVEMVAYIKESFTNILRSLDWMDEETRKHALAKAAAVVDHIGYPDELLDDQKLVKHFEALNVDSKQYFASHLNIHTHSTLFSLKRLREPVNKTDWTKHGSVAQVNAFCLLLENSIMFPAGILQGSFFHKDRPRYMNFGSIGSVIGHELTHGFDDTGKQFDKNGNLIDWWAHKTKEAFLHKTQCIINQYGNYTVPGSNEHLNGFNTQGENIADNGGLKEAYLAYQAWVKNNAPEPKLPGLPFSPNQLFWISAAMNWCASYRPEVVTVLVETDNHSINEFRVLGPFSNSEYFSKDFSCPRGSRMNPLHKCSVW